MQKLSWLYPLEELPINEKTPDGKTALQVAQEKLQEASQQNLPADKIQELKRIIKRLNTAALSEQFILIAPTSVTVEQFDD